MRCPLRKTPLALCRSCTHQWPLPKNTSACRRLTTPSVMRIWQSEWRPMVTRWVKRCLVPSDKVICIAGGATALMEVSSGSGKGQGINWPGYWHHTVLDGARQGGVYLEFSEQDAANRLSRNAYRPTPSSFCCLYPGARYSKSMELGLAIADSKAAAMRWR